jgi:Protein of unknown function (DUF2510)
MSATPPGWYPDPGGPPGLRYFDGSQWTGHADAGVPRTAPPPASRPAELGVGRGGEIHVTREPHPSGSPP